jgi:hypothetical protein
MCWAVGLKHQNTRHPLHVLVLPLSLPRNRILRRLQPCSYTKEKLWSWVFFFPSSVFSCINCWTIQFIVAIHFYG